MGHSRRIAHSLIVSLQRRNGRSDAWGKNSITKKELIMKYTLPLSCIFSACVVLSGCQTNTMMNPLQSTHLTMAQSIETGITFDKNEIAVAKLAKKRAVSPRVKQYANYLHEHYTTDLHKKLKYVHNEHITLETSKAATDLQDHGRLEIARLEAASPAHFDREFIQESIKDQEGAIQYFDNAIHNETNPHAIAKLKEQRKHAEVCLKKAQKIQQSMGQ